MNLEMFLRKVHRNAPCAYLWLLDKFGNKKSYWYKTEDFSKAINVAVKYREHVNVYFGVHGTQVSKQKWQRATERDELYVNCLYADYDVEYDEKDFVSRFAITPSFVVATGGGYHCYWMLRDTIVVNHNNIDVVKYVQRDWVLRCEADRAACDLARVLRLPGTYNHKYSPKRAVRMIHWCSAEYSLDELGYCLTKEPQRSPMREWESAKEIYAGAYEQIIYEITHATLGNRNNTLYKKAFYAFCLSIEGKIEQSIETVERDMIDAGVAVGL
ncbi:MAG: hypothetical protein ACK42Y_11430, partial [Candidatus Thermochlorobacter sp.]